MAMIAFALLLAAQDYYPPPDSAGGWRTVKDAAQARELAGIDLAKLDQAWEQTQRCTQNAGLVVVRRGYLVYAKDSGAVSRSHRIRNLDCEIVVAAIDVEQEPRNVLTQVEVLAERVVREATSLSAAA